MGFKSLKSSQGAGRAGHPAAHRGDYSSSQGHPHRSERPSILSLITRTPEHRRSNDGVRLHQTRPHVAWLARSLTRTGARDTSSPTSQSASKSSHPNTDHKRFCWKLQVLSVRCPLYTSAHIMPSAGGSGRPSSPVAATLLHQEGSESEASSSSPSHLPRAAAGFDSPVTTKMVRNHQHPTKLSAYPRLPGSSPYASPVPLKPTSTLQNMGAPRTMPSPPLSPAGSSAFLQNHALNQDPNFKLVKEEINKTMERERERSSALVARETENYTTIEEYKHALARERRYSATLSLELTHYKFLTTYTSCTVHTGRAWPWFVPPFCSKITLFLPSAAEYSEEARINSIMRHVDSMKHSLEKEKARAVMEVECEEEKIVNRLSKCREAFLCRLAHANESVWIICQWNGCK